MIWQRSAGRTGEIGVLGRYHFTTRWRDMTVSVKHIRSFAVTQMYTLCIAVRILSYRIVLPFCSSVYRITQKKKSRNILDYIDFFGYVEA